MSFLEALKQKKQKLKETETVVKTLASTLPKERPDNTNKNQTILIMSKNWLVHRWLTPKLKMVLLTTDKSIEQMDNAAKHAYMHVETVPEYDGGYIEYKALQLHKKFNFTHVFYLKVLMEGYFFV